MRIASWNVNSIKQRLDSAVTWLAERKPDIVCLQRPNVDDAFPREPFEVLGYNVAVHGQKTFNGVALLSKFPSRRSQQRSPRRRSGRPCPVHGSSLTWEEIVRLYRLTLDQPLVNTQAR